MVVAGYTGHGPSGGIQEHSKGALFPYTVIARGNASRGTAALSWHAMDLRTGNEGKACRSYKEAELDAHSLRIRNMMHG